MTTQAIFGLGVPELLIILAVILLLFGGSRLAGLGKSTGRALKEFKEETKGLSAKEESGKATDANPQPYPDRSVDAPSNEWPTQSTRPDPNVTDVRRDV